MPQPNRVDLRGRLAAGARRTLSMAISLLPILIAMLTPTTQHVLHLAP
jgi:hypothetical protein